MRGIKYNPGNRHPKTVGRNAESADIRRRTLERVISKAGLGSRTEARGWIGAGRVTVNGKKVQSPDAWVDPERDRITVDGRPLRAREKIYLLLYKPKGYLTTYQDPEGRPTVYDLIEDRKHRDQKEKGPKDQNHREGKGPQDQERKEWVFPVGRLDRDTTGLLILTNDTAFGDYIASPASKVPKTYLVNASPLLSDDQLDMLRRGVELTDGLTRPAIVQRVRDTARYTSFEITITEGRNRQVRRMVEALGAKVLKLVRTRIGPIEIGSLEIGKHRPLTRREVSLLLK